MKYSVSVPEEYEKNLTQELINDLERRLGVKINKRFNEVEIEGEAIDVMKAANVIKAIGYGFSQDVALLLLDDENYIMEVIELPRNEKERTRIKARIIGRNGIVRRNIERYTNCNVSVAEKEVVIIGEIDRVQYAKQAILMLIEGKKHSTMYKYLESLRKRGVLQ